MLFMLRKALFGLVNSKPFEQFCTRLIKFVDILTLSPVLCLPQFLVSDYNRLLSELSNCGIVFATPLQS